MNDTILMTLLRLPLKVLGVGVYRWALVTRCGAVAEDMGMQQAFRTRTEAALKLSGLHRHFTYVYGQLHVRLLRDDDVRSRYGNAPRPSVKPTGRINTLRERH